MSTLSVSGLECWRGERCLWGGLSFEVSSGTGLCIKGDNGVGKSSLLRVLAGLLPYEGTVTWQGLHDFPPLYLGHHMPRHGRLSVGKQLAFYHHIAQQAGAASKCFSTAEVLITLGLKGYENEPLYTLSEGQKKRVALARLLVQEAEVWLLDEPTHGLDDKGHLLLKEWIKAHLERRGIIIMTSHYPEPWEHLSYLHMAHLTPERLVIYGKEVLCSSQS